MLVMITDPDIVKVCQNGHHKLLLLLTSMFMSMLCLCFASDQGEID